MPNAFNGPDGTGTEGEGGGGAARETGSVRAAHTETQEGESEPHQGDSAAQ